MKKDDHYLLGSLLKTSGIKGEILLKFNNDCTEEIQELESIFIDVDNKLVPFFIEGIRVKSNSTAVVKLEGIGDDLQAIEFIGLDFYISFEQVDQLQLETTEFVDVVNYKVFDQNSKFIGVVVEFIDIPKNPLLNVKTEKGEVLIPAKEEVILAINNNIKEIQLTLTDGLLDID
ncbi:MAG: 16S rRNA processing protein RimM [Marinilabiliales bacterium]|nr:MAG: 16S rRNA processing protein RimM [Marinilabiliales bacterium]